MQLSGSEGIRALPFTVLGLAFLAVAGLLGSALPWVRLGLLSLSLGFFGYGAFRVLWGWRDPDR